MSERRKRRPDFVLIAAGLALLAITTILVTRGREPDIWPSEASTESATSPGETTFRNVTNEIVHYKLHSSRPPSLSEERSLEPGGLDRFKTKGHLEVIYTSDGKELFFIASPGKPYSFRYNEDDLVRIYPGSHSYEDVADLAPYVQTPMPVVEKMLELAGLDSSDLLYDLGCGDGRIVITAAKTYGARGVGIDINSVLVEESRANAEREGVAELTRFLCMDATKADLTGATAVAIYLLPESNALLRPKFERELKQGAHIVSHNYTIPGWEERLIEVVSVEDEKGKAHNVLLYRR